MVNVVGAPAILLKNLALKGYVLLIQPVRQTKIAVSFNLIVKQRELDA